MAERGRKDQFAGLYELAFTTPSLQLQTIASPFDRILELKGITVDPKLEPQEREIVLVRHLAHHLDVPLAQASLLVYAHDSFPRWVEENPTGLGGVREEDIIGYALSAPETLAGEMAPRVFDFVELVREYDDPRFLNYVAEIGQATWRDAEAMKEVQATAIQTLRGYYSQVDPYISKVYAKAAFHIGKTAAKLAILERNRGKMSHAHAQTLPFAGTVALELAATVHTEFRPQMLGLFPHPKTGEPLSLQTFENRGV